MPQRRHLKRILPVRRNAPDAVEDRRSGHAGEYVAMTVKSDPVLGELWANVWDAEYDRLSPRSQSSREPRRGRSRD